jgi:hypothetical protein
MRMLKIIFTNNASMPIGVTSVAVAFRTKAGALMNSDLAITNIYMLDAAGATLESRAAASSAYAVFTPASFTVPASGSAEMIFAVDMSTSILQSFYIELASGGDVSTSPPATLVPAPGELFGNLRSGAPSIQPRDLSRSYHGFPNPFNPERENLTVEYYLAGDSTVTIKLYTIYGRFVRTIAEAALKNAGLHADDFWDGKNATQNSVKSGVYLCVLEVNDLVTGNSVKMTRKVVLLR